MASPTPIQSLIGGLSIPVAAHALLLLNGNVFGISGFIHRAMRGSFEGLAGALGLILGGAIAANAEGMGPAPLSLPLSKVLFSGFLVGLGTKLANGCTSGHMICGVSRFSVRSIVATATFFVTAAVTTQVVHGDLPPVGTTDWTLGSHGLNLLALQAVPFSLSVLLYALTPASVNKSEAEPADSSPSKLRILAYLSTGVQFALALRLSNLSEASRVLSFLVLPFHRAFDPSLAFVAGGALSLGILLYNYARGSEHARLGGKWSIPKGGDVDAKLLLGSAIFGLGWGMAGICPGPGLVNLGRALGAGGRELIPYAGWLGSMALGGLLA
ncbi:hypothetical protein B0H34DRAFT_795197 [Crassisporium funariophilum]|nr:hypothetical protein B0H34DRAFT_795197 [Crassisporium funariophilum]